MSVDPDLVELLELIRVSEAQGKPFILNQHPIKLGISRNKANELLETAIRGGFVNFNKNIFRLTERGRQEVQKHREEFIHDRYIHKDSFLHRISKIFDGGIKDWHNHWHRRHGFDENSLKEFYINIRNLEDRIEKTTTLADLNQDEKVKVAFVIGGRGLVTRLTEMGLTPGTELTVLRSAPFMGPIEISLRGVSLALGRGVASKVFVTRFTGEN
jgi:Fe2+ transport system protein FeoA